MADDRPALTSELIQEAKRNPGGWVNQIEGDFGPDDAIPREAIAGAWKVDENVVIEGEFIPNPNFRRPASAPGRGGSPRGSSRTVRGRRPVLQGTPSSGATLRHRTGGSGGRRRPLEGPPPSTSRATRSIRPSTRSD